MYDVMIIRHNTTATIGQGLYLASYENYGGYSVPSLCLICNSSWYPEYFPKTFSIHPLIGDIHQSITPIAINTIKYKHPTQIDYHSLTLVKISSMALDNIN